MALKVNDFEGTDGVGVTTGNSAAVAGDAFSLVNTGAGGTIAYDAANAFTGNTCGMFDQPTAANQPVTVQMSDGSGVTSFTLRIYAKYTGNPSGDMILMQLRTTADAQLLSLNLTSTGLLRIKNAGGTILATGTVAVTLNAYQRFEFYGTGLNGAAGSFTAAFYSGHSTTATDTVTASSATTSGLVDRVRYGRMSAVTLATWYMDGLAQDLGSATPLGPIPMVPVSASDTATLADTSALTQTRDAVDAATITDVSSLAIQQSLSMSDTATLFESPADVGILFSVMDSATFVEDSSELTTDAGLDDAFLSESASIEIAIAPSLFDTVLFSDFASVQKIAITATLRTVKVGSYWQSPRQEDRYRLFYKIPIAASLARVDGVWMDVTNPSAEFVESAEYFFGGGRTFTIPSSLATELIAAGYGEYITEDL